MAQPLSFWRPVSYTHLDVYKRQLMGNGYTTYREIQKAPSREESFERKARLALEVPGMSREELKDRGEELETEFEYRKGLDKIQNAFRILEENKLNVFRE